MIPTGVWNSTTYKGGGIDLLLVIPDNKTRDSGHKLWLQRLKLILGEKKILRERSTALEEIAQSGCGLSVTGAFFRCG